jgi:hypothetical protein
MFLFPVVVFAQQPWYKYSPMDYAWKDVGNAGFSVSEAWYTSLAFSPSGQPYVAYEDWAADYSKATVMMFDGNSWGTVGYSGFSAGQARYTSLAISPSDGQPYVAYQDGGNYWRATVMKFNGSIWVNVGIPGFSIGEASNIDLVFDSSEDVPYITFSCTLDTDKATVMKFDGISWVYIGKSGFSKGVVSDLSLAFSPIDGHPYVAYCDEADSGKATVMKFDGTNWVNVGVEGFSAGGIASASLAFSQAGQPYVAYQDGADSGKATVMKFDGTNWIIVGNEGFSAGYVMGTSLAFSPSDGLPYVGYTDWVTNPNGKATVMKYNGTNWIKVGSSGFSAGQAASTSLAFSPVGKPYIAYEDFGNSQKATVMYYDSVYVGVKEQQKSKFSLYPNPATDKITIEIAEGQVTSQLSMRNLNGEEILTCSLIKPKTQIDISNLSIGVYFVRLTKERAVDVGKFVKN